jgi:diguanylate cyclase (GGDEF)-like protein
MRIAAIERWGRWGYAVPIPTSSFVDLPTLCAVAMLVSVTGGLLLLFSWMQNRSEPALALWGLSYLIGSVGVGLMALGRTGPNGSLVCVANALICLAYGVLWAGARGFEGRRISPALIAAGAVIWLAACQFTGFLASLQARIALASAISAAYLLLAAREVRDGRDHELMSRWPAVAILVLHAAFMLARVPLVGLMANRPPIGQPYGLGVCIMAFEAVFASYCMAFLRMSMAKERAELEQRRASLTDSLTGIANRRAFFEFGSPLLERTIADRRDAALLLFDLDRFKEVNDTGGHQTGDSVLQAFSQLVTTTVRPSDLFARVGGEEFALLLTDVPMAEAMRVAERVRGEFARTPLAGLATNATVSAGVAMANDANRTLSTLLVTADRALYRAKAEGRNRVAAAPLVLVNASGNEDLTIGIAQSSELPAPLAG